MPEAITLTISDGGQITSVDWCAFLLQELETPATRDMVARTYAYIIRSGRTDIREVNQAIIKRWSPSGLRYVKEKAWNIAKESVFMNTWLCKLGRFSWHREIIREQRNYSRVVSDGIETVDAKSVSECACGHITESESHSSNSVKVTQAEEFELAEA